MFTGCNYGFDGRTWPPWRLGTPDLYTGEAYAYLTLNSSRSWVYAGTDTWCGHAGGVPGQHVEVCDAVIGSNSYPYEAYRICS
jgi:hypothetical protein